jgi:D-alanine-D-alanine ligase
MNNFGKVAVLMGGPSAERAVSLNSGNAVLAALKRKGVDAHGIDADTDVLRVLQDGKFDRAFIVLHGRWGEDGVIQGALESIGMPYTGSGVLGSALGMDKLRSRFLLSAVGIPVPQYEVLKRDTDFAAVVKKLGLPIFVKPSREGSSIGISKVKRAEDLVAAFEAAVKYDDDVIAERAIVGPELSCPVVGGQAFPLVRIEPATEFYDYDAKYLRDDTRYHCPSGLDAALEREVQELALRTFELLGCRGWARVDFMLDPTNKPYVLEVNTVPGMTDHSLVPKAAKQAGIGFEDLCLRILELSLSGQDE